MWGQTWFRIIWSTISLLEAASSLVSTFFSKCNNAWCSLLHLLQRRLLIHLTTWCPCDKQLLQHCFSLTILFLSVTFLSWNFLDNHKGWFSQQSKQDCVDLRNYLLFELVAVSVLPLLSALAFPLAETSFRLRRYISKNSSRLDQQGVFSSSNFLLSLRVSSSKRYVAMYTMIKSAATLKQCRSTFS